MIPVTETTIALAGAIMKLTASLKNHPVARSIAYLDASIDVVAFNADPEDPDAVRALEKSAEDLLDELGSDVRVAAPAGAQQGRAAREIR